LKAESRRVEASGFNRSTTQKRKPKFSTVRSTVGARFWCKTAQFCATRCESEMTADTLAVMGLQKDASY